MEIIKKIKCNVSQECYFYLLNNVATYININDLYKIRHLDDEFFKIFKNFFMKNSDEEYMYDFVFEIDDVNLLKKLTHINGLPDYGFTEMFNRENVKKIKQKQYIISRCVNKKAFNCIEWYIKNITNINTIDFSIIEHKIKEIDIECISFFYNLNLTKTLVIRYIGGNIISILLEYILNYYNVNNLLNNTDYVQNINNYFDIDYSSRKNEDMQFLYLQIKKYVYNDISYNIIKQSILDMFDEISQRNHIIRINSAKSYINDILQNITNT